MSHTGLKSLDQVAQTICLPNERAPVRLPTYPSIDKTALFRYRYQNTESLRDDKLVAPGDLDTLNIPGRKRFLLSRDPAAPLLIDTVHLLQHTWGLNPVAFDGTIFIRGESTLLVDSTAGMETVHSVDYDKCYPIEYYNTLPTGKLEGKEWFLVPRVLDSRGKSQGFLDRLCVGLITEDGPFPPTANPLGTGLIRTYQNSSLTPVINAVADELCLDYTITIEVMNYLGGVQDIVMSYDWSRLNFTGTYYLDPDVSMVRIKSLSYVGLVHLLNGPNQPGGTVAIKGCYPVLGLSRSGAHIPQDSPPTTFRCLSLPATPINPEYYNSIAPFQSTRLNSSALLLTNVTKVLNKEGTVQSSRLLFNPNAGRTFHHADVVSVSTSNPDTRYFGALEKGAYTFTAPDQESLKFVTPYITVTVNDTGTDEGNIIPLTLVPSRSVVRPVLDLGAKYYNCIICTDLDSTDDTQLAMTLDTHWEFRTISTLYALDYSRIPMEVYHAAMLAVVKAGFFYENNSHSAILRMLSAGVKFAAPLVAGYAASIPAGFLNAQATSAVAKGAVNLAHYGAKKAHAAYKAHQHKKKSKQKPKNKERGNMRQKGLR